MAITRPRCQPLKDPALAAGADSLAGFSNTFPGSFRSWAKSVILLGSFGSLGMLIVLSAIAVDNASTHKGKDCEAPIHLGHCFSKKELSILLNLKVISFPVDKNHSL